MPAAETPDPTGTKSASPDVDTGDDIEAGPPDLFEKVVNLCKRRGIIFNSAEIYGGFRSAYDYGPIGVQLLRNVKDAWWHAMVQMRHDVVGLDAAILSPPQIWEASGHLENFTDPLVDCKSCRQRHRQDQLEDLNTCPACGKQGTFTEARQFNLMFQTHAGPVAGAGTEVYLRPETAQGMFVNFKNVLETTRKSPPFGIAQVGKSFRNEITPGNFVFRTREFEQMEMEYFVPPADAQHWYEYWLQERMQWYLDLGIAEQLLRLRPHEADELSHYSSATSDVEFLFPWGWGELEGIANRGDFDLRQHAEHSGQKLEYFDQASGEHYVPHCIEPAAGATRSAMAFLMASYREEDVHSDKGDKGEKGKSEKRTVLGLHPRLAPYKVAILPLSRKEPLLEVAEQVLAQCQPHWMCDYDITQAIGRRYRRQDEIGTPLCVTIDFESLDDKAVTVRHRDTMAQDRVAISGLVDHIEGCLGL